MKNGFKLCWGSDYFNVGNAYGYSVHNRMMREYVGRIVTLDDDAPVALTIASGDKFMPVPGKRKNFAFSMFETPDLPKTYVENLERADHLIVPCRWLEVVFKRHFPTKPVSWCWEGTDPELFTYVERRLPFSSGKRFRYLWVGAPNPRKGYFLVNQFARVVERVPHVELYMKTTAPPRPSDEEIEQYVKRNWARLVERYGELGARNLIQDMRSRKDVAGKIHVWGEHKNIIVDTRDLSVQELVELYHSAHCFLLPTLGEGFGLTLCEAMATGLPCVATSVTGTKDFFDSEVGYPIRYQWTNTRLDNYDLSTKIPLPDVNDFVVKATRVAENYHKALRKGERAAERIRSKFTWPKAAERLIQILEG